MYTFAKFCRLCFKNNKFLINYEDTDLCNISYYDKIKKMIPMLVTDQTEYFPTWICVSCRTDLDRLYIFHEKCLKTHELLKQYSKQLGFAVPKTVKNEVPEHIIEQRLDIVDENPLSLDVNLIQSNVKNEIPEAYEEQTTSNLNIIYEIQDNISIVKTEIRETEEQENNFTTNAGEESERHENMTEEISPLETEIYDINSRNNFMQHKRIVEEILTSKNNSETEEVSSKKPNLRAKRRSLLSVSNNCESQPETIFNSNFANNIKSYISILTSDKNTKTSNIIDLVETDIDDEESTRHENITEEISTLETEIDDENFGNEETLRMQENLTLLQTIINERKFKNKESTRRHENIIEYISSSDTEINDESSRNEGSIGRNEIIKEKISTLDTVINDESSRNEESLREHENIKFLKSIINDKNIRKEDSSRLENITESNSTLETEINDKNLRNNTRRHENIREEISTLEIEINDENIGNEETLRLQENLTLLQTIRNKRNLQNKESTRGHENIKENISMLNTEINDESSRNGESLREHETIINDKNIREEDSTRPENNSTLETEINDKNSRNKESTRNNGSISEEILNLEMEIYDESSTSEESIGGNEDMLTSENDENFGTEEVSSKRPIIRNKRRFTSISYNEVSENEDFSASDSNDSDFQPEKIFKSNFEKKISSIISETSDKNIKPNIINNLVQTDNQNILNSITINSSDANKNVNNSIQKDDENISESDLIDFNSSDKSLNVANPNISELNIDPESDNSNKLQIPSTTNIQANE